MKEDLNKLKDLNLPEGKVEKTLKGILNFLW
jgi:hypothetical protein